MTVKEIRNLSGLNQTEFSKKYDIPLRTLSHWEKGDREAPPCRSGYLLLRFLFL